MRAGHFRKIITGAIGIACASLASCNASEEDSTDLPAESAASEPSKPTANVENAALNQCRTCHTFGMGEQHGVGPNLWNAYGKAAASKPDYAYSAALDNSDLVWDDEALHAYLDNPRKTVPGGKMSYAGLRDAARRQQVIDYLKSASDEAE